MEKHIRQIYSELSQEYYKATEIEKRKASLFSELACPYCSTIINSLEELILNELTGQPECPMCIEIERCKRGEY